MYSHDDKKERSPVRQDRRKVARNLAKVLAPGDRSHQVDDGEEDDVEDAGHLHEDRVECLHAQCSRVRVGRVGRDGRKGAEHEQELAKPAERAEERTGNAADGVVLERVGVCEQRSI